VFGAVDRSRYHNVLVIALENALALESMERDADNRPFLYDVISRDAPAAQGFEFHSTEEFIERASSIIRNGCRACVAIHSMCGLNRRGFKHGLRAPDVERLLDPDVLEALRQAGTPGSIPFSNPDLVIWSAWHRRARPYWFALPQGRRGSRLRNQGSDFVEMFVGAARYGASPMRRARPTLA
jgi:hypothetical protein